MFIHGTHLGGRVKIRNHTLSESLRWPWIWLCAHRPVVMTVRTRARLISDWYKAGYEFARFRQEYRFGFAGGSNAASAKDTLEKNDHNDN